MARVVVEMTAQLQRCLSPLRIALATNWQRFVQLPARRTSANCGRLKRPPQVGELAVETGVWSSQFSGHAKMGGFGGGIHSLRQSSYLCGTWRRSLTVAGTGPGL